MTPNFWAPACMLSSAVAALALRPSGACQTYQSPRPATGPEERRCGKRGAESGTGPLLVRKAGQVHYWQYGQPEKSPDLAISDLSRFRFPLLAIWATRKVA